MRLYSGTQHINNDSARDPGKWDYTRTSPNQVAFSDRHLWNRRNPSASSRRLLRPRYLCVIDKAHQSGYQVVFCAENPAVNSMPYIFISYTRKHFFTDIRGDPSAVGEAVPRRRELAASDAKTLTSLAVCAADQANVLAFWIDFECVRPEGPESSGDPEASRSMEDVYHICDIVRTCQSMVIIVGPPLSKDFEHEATDYSTNAQRLWLRQWGERLWTLPEALLCPSNHGIIVYSIREAGATVEKIEKRNLAVHVWEDAETVRELVDHYEGSISLTQLELMTIALQSLQRRQTVPRMNADVIYALMGLMRERVTVRPNESAFKAFAYLSAANDSQMLLERLFCMQPVSHTAPWHDISDVWGARPWDITPECQVTEVTDGDAVVLGGMCGAYIHWQPLPPIDFEMAASNARDGRHWRWHRMGAAAITRFMVSVWVIALLHWLINSFLPRSTGRRYGMNIQFNIILAPTLLLSAIYLLIPPAHYNLYRGQVLHVQARFYGFHGIADLETVDRMLFGRSCNRLSWSTLNPQDESPPGTGGEDHTTFTLVDTWSMTANTFQARSRPSVVGMAGRQGGYLRTILCSYDAFSKTFVREKVLRMETRIIQRMGRMDPARFSLMVKARYSDN